MIAELVSRGVDSVGPEAATGTGTVVSIAEPDGKRTMLSDRGVAPGLRPEDIDAAVRRAGRARFREACLELAPSTALATEREEELVGRLPAPTWVAAP